LQPEESNIQSCEPDPVESENIPMIQEWPPPVTYRSPRPQRKKQIPARYRD